MRCFLYRVGNKLHKLVMTDRRFILFSLGSMLIFAPEFQTPNYIAVRLAEEFSPRSYHLFDWFSIELTGIKIFSLIQLENTLLVVFFSLVVTKLIQHMKEAPALHISGTYLAKIVHDDLRSSYMAVNGLIVQGARILGAISITLGAILPSYLMALLFFALGVIGVILIHSVATQIDSEESLIPHTAKAAR
jgi:MFS transporter, DHA1 family, multidrug resistance protein B